MTRTVLFTFPVMLAVMVFQEWLCSKVSQFLNCLKQTESSGSEERTAGKPVDRLSDEAIEVGKKLSTVSPSETSHVYVSAVVSTTQTIF